MRLQTKCMFGSAMVHTLLLVALLVGSAFVPPKKTEAPLPVFKMFKVTDDVTMGNGIPAAESRISEPAPAPAAAAPQNTTPAPPPPPAPVETKPIEKKQEVKPESKPETKPETKPIQKPEPVKPPAVKPRTQTKKITPLPKPVEETKPVVKTEPHVIVPDLNTVKKPDPKVAEQKAELRRKRQEEKERAQAEAKRQYDDAMRAYQKSLSDANAKAQADAAARLQAMNKVTDTLGNSLSGTSSLVTMPEPGGEAFVNYSQLIWSKYYEAWRPPGERSNDSTVRVEIVISKDGRVTSARVVGRSGDAALDKSVREALDRVRLFPPFPQGATESERTFKINFNLKAKRLIG
jgi:protein TonB